MNLCTIKKPETLLQFFIAHTSTKQETVIRVSFKYQNNIYKSNIIHWFRTLTVMYPHIPLVKITRVSKWTHLSLMHISNFMSEH